MRLPNSRHRTPVGANMTPMIDVVFLLIIFFLVSSHLARQESRMPLELPEAESSAAADLQRQALTVNIDADSDLIVGGNRLRESELTAVMAEHLQRRGKQAAIRIRTHRFATYRSVQPVLRAAAKLGIVDVSLSVRSPTSVVR